MKRPKVLVSDLRWRTNDWRKDNFWRANYPPKINMSLKKGPFYRGNFIDSTPQFSGDVWYMGMLVFSLGYIKLQGITKTKQQQINLCHYLVLNLVCLGIHLFPPSAGVLSTHWHKNSPSYWRAAAVSLRCSVCCGNLPARVIGNPTQTGRSVPEGPSLFCLKILINHHICGRLLTVSHHYRHYLRNKSKTNNIHL